MSRRSGHGESPAGASRHLSFDRSRSGPSAGSDALGAGRGRADDHYALVYESRTAQFDAAAAFVREGLESDEHCLYVAGENGREEVLAALRERGVDVDAARSAGELAVVDAADVYYRRESFDPEEAVDHLRGVVEDAAAGVRVTSELAGVLGDGRADALVEYEAKLHALLDDADARALCQYDRDRFSAAVVRDVISTHPQLVYDGRVCRNAHFTPPEEFRGPEQTEREVDHLLASLRDQAAARDALEVREAFLRECYQVTSDPSLGFEAKLHRLLDLGREWMGVDAAGLTHLPSWDNEFRTEYAIGYGDGADDTDGDGVVDASDDLWTDPGEGCYCRQAITADAPVGMADVRGTAWEDDDIYQEHGLTCYLGTKVTDGSEPYGTLWVGGTEPRDREFTETERTFLDLIGQWVSYELERREREADLEQAKAHFEQIFERSHDAIYLNDPYADEILDVNPAGCDLLGYDREEVLARSPSDFHPDEMDRFREFVGGVYEDGSNWTDELTCLHRDGTRIPVELSASRVELDDRDAMLAVVRDVSDRREHERFQRLLYEITADPDRSTAEKVDELLSVGCERLGVDIGMLTREREHAFEVEHMAGQHPELDEGTMTPPLTDNYCRRVVDTGMSISVGDAGAAGWDGDALYDELDLQCYAGTELVVRGETYGTVCFTDTSPREPFTETEQSFVELLGQCISYELERERHEADLKETIERLEQSNDRLKQFAYAASHDLQEPLRMVSSYLQLLERRCGDELGEDAREYIEFAVDGADRMREMVDDLLAFSRVEQRDAEAEPVDVDAVVDHVTDDLAVQLEENGAEVVTGSLPTVHANEEQLEQLFANLVSNAVKYNESATPRVEITAEQRGDDWAFAVSDNGIGIDPERTDRIFEVFKRLHNDDDYQGTGIGLALCQEIVENHGGDIWVESEPGDGSTFWFTLPDGSEGADRDDR